MKDFKFILGTCGGEMERQRGKELLDQVTVVPDDVSLRVHHLGISGKVKSRAKVCGHIPVFWR